MSIKKVISVPKDSFYKKEDCKGGKFYRNMHFQIAVFKFLPALEKNKFQVHFV